MHVFVSFLSSLSSNSFRRPPTVKISSHSSNPFVTFLFLLHLSPARRCFMEATCSLDLHSTSKSRSSAKQQRSQQKKLCVSLIVKISVIFLLYQWKLSQCQFISAFSVLNRFANKRKMPKKCSRCGIELVGVGACIVDR